MSRILYGIRLGVYTDYAYHLRGGRPYAERAFALFLARLAPRFERLVVVGRLDPSPARVRYPLGRDVDFVPLPFYPSLARPGRALRSLGPALRRFWRALDRVDCVWLLGPNPFAIAFAVLASLRGRRVVLGVRQDYMAYVRARHPGRRGIALLARLLDLGFRALARRHPVVVVGPELVEPYAHGPAVLETAVSLVEESDIVAPQAVLGRSYADELRILSVGRLEQEKNPLLLAQVLRLLRADGRPWRLVVCGEGPMAGALEAELDRLGLSGAAELRGYVAQDDGLRRLYRETHAFLHVSWTEGLPQVLLEAFAAGLPTVATDVGGIRRAVGGAVRLVPPGQPDAAARALAEIAASAELRARLVRAGHDYVAAHTIDREAMHVADFMNGGADTAPGGVAR